MDLSPALFAIYNAEGSFIGKLKYSFGKSLGLAQCALCDLSHGWNPVGKTYWRQSTGLLAGMHWLHRNELPAHLMHLTRGKLPCVVIQTGDDVAILINRDSLKNCNGDLSKFENLVEEKLRAL